MGQSQEKTEAERDLVKELRQDHRIAVHWSALIRVEGDNGEHELECEILNVSLNGVKIHLDEELTPGIDVEIEISDLATLTGRTVWSLVDRAGIVLNGNPDTIKATIFSRARLEEEGGEVTRPKPKTKPKAKPGSKPKTKSKAKPKSKAKAKSKAKPKPKAKPKAKK